MSNLNENSAAIIIQKYWRGYLARKGYQDLERKNYFAIKIQKCWKKYHRKLLFQKLSQTLALFRISLFIRRHRFKMKQKKEKSRLISFDPLLSFYPTNSQPSINTKKPKISTLSIPLIPKSITSRKNEFLKIEKKSQTSRKISSSIILKKNSTISNSISNNKKSSKSKIIIELPPPWHDRDPRRFSQTQKDELIYLQKSIFQWAKLDLIPPLIKKINPLLDIRDQLLVKNNKFKYRLVPKLFTIPLSRHILNNTIKFPRDYSFLLNSNLFFITSSVSLTAIQFGKSTECNILFRRRYPTKAPLIDVLIFNKNGIIIGIDAKWTLCLFEQDILVLTYQLFVSNLIPKINKYMLFDRNDLLWINLFPQGGNLICFDPITLQPCVQINLEQTLNLKKNFKLTKSFISLELNQISIGFAFSFVNSSEIILISNEFHISKSLENPFLKENPKFKQISDKLFVWGKSNILYIYQLSNPLVLTELIREIQLNSIPIDITGINNPDLYFIGFEDTSCDIFLGTPNNFALRIPNKRLTDIEQKFTEKMIGSEQNTNSRSFFSIIYNF